MRRRAAATVLLLALLACSGPPSPAQSAAATLGADSARLVTTVRGFSGPEAVRYDPDQDVWFVANFNGRGGDRDDNGFISRMHPDGEVERMRWVAGGANGVTLHAPRGMAIVGDTLWVCDVDAVRGFHRRTGAPVASIPFTSIDVGFLNDIAPGPDGALYATDTRRNRIYRIAGRDVTIALADSALGAPNGITWVADADHFVIVPFGGGHTLHAWRPGASTLDSAGTSAGARFDGVEPLSDGRLIVASQADSTLQLVERGTGRPIARTAGAPADIGLDTRRQRVAVPFIALNMVEIWQLPGGAVP